MITKGNFFCNTIVKIVMLFNKSINFSTNIFMFLQVYKLKRKNCSGVLAASQYILVSFRYFQLSSGMT